MIDFTQEKPISYQTAITRPDKQGICVFTLVLWDGAPKQYVELVLETIGPTKVLLPPKLPRGYAMQIHSSWNDLQDAMYLPASNNYSFEYLDAVGRDRRKLQQLNIEVDDIPYSADYRLESLPDNIHDDYWEWKCQLEDAWGGLEHYIRSLSELIIEAKNQAVLPPKPVDVLKEMLEAAEQGWKPEAD